MKDKEGHGSDRGYLNSPEHHGRNNMAEGKDNAWGQSPEVAKSVRKDLRNERKMQLTKPPSQRRQLP